MAQFDIDAALSQKPDIEAALSATTPTQQTTFGKTVDALNAAVPGLRLGDLGGAIVHHAMNFPHGAAQFIENGAGKLADWIDPNYSTVNPSRSGWNQALHDTIAKDNAGMQAREKEYQGAVSNSPQAYVGATAGEVVPFLFSGMTSGLTKTGDVVSSPFTKFATSNPLTTQQKLAALLAKTTSGAAQGASIGLAAPVNSGDYWLTKGDQAGTGAALGGAIPLVAAGGKALSNSLRSNAATLMQSAIKPTIKQLRSGDAAVAVKTLLDNGISPNEAGVDRLRTMIGDVNDQIGSSIANSPATVDPNRVLTALTDVRNKFANQVTPTGDLSAINNAANEFMNNPKVRNAPIPVQVAQELKQGTYRVLNKKYGQLGSADIETQKALARGLKEGIAEQVPGIQGLNNTESNLIKTLNVVERRALMELNKNPVGLALLAHNPANFAAFMADKSAAFKALLARLINGSSGIPQTLTIPLENPAIRSGAVAGTVNN